MKKDELLTDFLKSIINNKADQKLLDMILNDNTNNEELLKKLLEK